MTDSSQAGDHQAPPEAPGVLEVEVLEPGADAGDQAAGDARDGVGGRLTAEQFREGLAATLRLCGGLTGLQSLASSPDSAQFPAAAAAIYDSAAEIPWLAWLLEPQSIWLQRAVAVGAWAAPVALSCRQELEQRRRAARAARRQAASSSSSAADQAGEGVRPA